jgi:hypothetical protein
VEISIMIQWKTHVIGCPKQREWGAVSFTHQPPYSRINNGTRGVDKDHTSPSVLKARAVGYEVSEYGE